jgi:hypothetical protein
MILVDQACLPQAAFSLFAFVFVLSEWQTG